MRASAGTELGCDVVVAGALHSADVTQRDHEWHRTLDPETHLQALAAEQGAQQQAVRLERLAALCQRSLHVGAASTFSACS